MLGPQPLIRLGRAFAADLDRGRGFLWMPVALGIGEAAYFAPNDEPPLRLSVLALGLAVTLVLLARQLSGHRRFPLHLLALALIGFAHADLMTLLAARPVVPQERTVTLRGVVEAVEERAGSGFRLLLRPLAIDPPLKSGLPEHVRVTVRGSAVAPQPGQGVEMLARLMPPALPYLPGGYDFARVAWFEGIGATGFSYGSHRMVPDVPSPDLGLRLRATIEQLRLALSTHVRARLSGDQGAIAAALLVGDQGAISDKAKEAMRAAGLSHVLSISGLHMSLVAAVLFAVVRLLLAAIAPIALNWPIKKIAALVALAGTVTYFVLSGMEVPAERSTIMVAIALAAVLVDRQALSMRVIAIAALVTLAVTPEAVVDPGAQMSFAAVIALLAAHEAYGDRKRPVDDGGDINPLVRGGGIVLRWVGAAMLTSLVAGAATLPSALYHFGRLAPLSILANLATAPLVSFLIMPAALLAMALMPLGLDGPALDLMGLGIEAMLRIAAMASAWTPSGGLVGRPEAFAALAMGFGGLWLCLWRGRKRLAGLPVIALGAVAALVLPPPDLWITGDGRLALLRMEDGTLRLVGRGQRFAAQLLLTAAGSSASTRDQELHKDTACDDAACLLKGSGGKTRLSVITRPAGFSDECAEARLIVSALEAPRWCDQPVLVFDGKRLNQTGALSLMVDQDFWDGGAQAGVVETARVLGDHPRLWYGGSWRW